MRAPALWHKVKLDAGRPILTTTAKVPGRGVWMQSVQKDANITEEYIARNGATVAMFACWTGQDRHNALHVAASYL